MTKIEKKAVIEGGATIWARQTIDSEIFLNKPAVWFKIWFYLVNRVSHADTKQYKRGETFLFLDWVGDATKASPDQIKKCFSWLRDMGMIRTRRSTRGVAVELPKYSHFQTLDNYYSEVEAPIEALEKHQRSTPILQEEEKDPPKTLAPQEGVGQVKNTNEPINENEPHFSKINVDELLTLTHPQLLWLVQKTGVDIPNIMDEAKKAVEWNQNAPKAKKKSDGLRYLKNWLENARRIPFMTNPEGIMIPPNTYTWGDGTTTIIAYQGGKRVERTMLTSEYHQQDAVQYQKNTLEAIANDTQK